VRYHPRIARVDRLGLPDALSTVGKPPTKDTFTVSAPASTSAGSVVKFTVTAILHAGGTDTAYAGTVTFSSTDTNASTVLPTQTTLSAGIGTFSATLTTAGNQKISAADSVTASASGASSSIAVSALTPASKFVLANPASVTHAVSFNTTVTATDKYGNLTKSYQSAGSFGSSSQWGSLTNGQKIVAGDVNNDGKIDLVFAIDAGAQPIGVLLGNGNGTFQALQTYGSQGFSSSFRSVALGDTNGDGNLDIACVGRGSGSGTLGILLSNGNGTFAAVNTYGSGISAQHVLLTDLNGDGYLDAVCANQDNNNVAVLLGNGNGTFQAPVTYSTGASSAPYSVSVGDLDGDGHPDIGVGINQAHQVGFLLGNGNGTFKAVNTLASGMNSSNSYTTVIADVNGDGSNDLVTSDRTGAVSVLLGNGNGTFQAPVTYATTGINGGMVVVDINNDGKLDLVLGSWPNNRFGTLLGNGNGTFQAPVTYATSSGFGNFVAVADFNADGLMDIAVIDYASPGQIETHLGLAGQLTFTSSDGSATLPANTSTLASGVGTFGVTLATVGSQTLTATDRSAASVAGASGTITVS